jgi:hypothetical protein
MHKKRANQPQEGMNTFFHLVTPQKIWGGGLGKSVSGLGLPRSHHKKNDWALDEIHGNQHSKTEK